ncbi:MAG: hypothetical protein ABL934_12245 [Lysobacteraceae bacterium]
MQQQTGGFESIVSNARIEPKPSTTPSASRQGTGDLSCPFPQKRNFNCFTVSPYP